MLRLGIIGAGGIASLHTHNILSGKCPEVQLTAMADRKESRREWIRATVPNAAVFCEGSDLIASDTCDAVLIATPHYQHPTLAIEAFRHGKHVLCEKPAGVYTLQVRDMIAEADKHPELTFGMMFNQRTNCVYRKAKELIDSGALGEIKRMIWVVTDWYRTQSYYDAGAWRATWDGEGGGVLLNQCPHQLDLLQWLCGLPVRVRAACHEGKWHDIEVEDDVTAYLEFANGATGTFIASTGDALGENRLEIIGTRARIRIENDQLTLDTLSVDERDWCPVCKEPFGVPENRAERNRPAPRRVERLCSAHPARYAACCRRARRYPRADAVHTNSHLKHVIRTASFPPRLCFVPLARTSSTPRFTQLCQNEKSAMLDAMF